MKIRMLAVTAAAMAMMGAGGAIAAGTSQNITITASVAGFCSTTGNASLTQSLTNDIVDGIATANSHDVSVGDFTCNTNAHVSLSSLKGALYDPAVTSATGPFYNRINYEAATTIGGASVTLAANRSDASPAPLSSTADTTGGAFVATGAKVTITPTVNTGHPLVAGTGYTDTLTLKVEPF